jgi:tRNA G18 (ribose-2'-O)-methylase SpoU
MRPGVIDQNACASWAGFVGRGRGEIFKMNVLSYCQSDLPDETQKAWAHRNDRPHVHFLLNDLQSPINIGKCARVAETFAMGLYIHDRRNLTGNSEVMKTVADFACGAWERRPKNVFSDIRTFLKSYKKGRLVATCLHKDAVRLHEFEFAEDDLIMFGNEYDGLSSDLIASADARIYIPMPKNYLPKPCSHSPIDPSRCHEVNQNGIPNLNVAVAAGIVGYAFSCWLEKNRHATIEHEDAMA